MKGVLTPETTNEEKERERGKRILKFQRWVIGRCHSHGEIVGELIWSQILSSVMVRLCMS